MFLKKRPLKMQINNFKYFFRGNYGKNFFWTETQGIVRNT